MLDTIITLNITDRTWQRDSLSAGVSLGAAGQAGAQHGRWHACAGATATLGRITATLRNVHGQIHLRADPGALDGFQRVSVHAPIRLTGGVSEVQALLAELPEGVDPCGENGELHTFVSAGPMLARPIAVRGGEIVERDGFVYADLLSA